MRDSCCFALTVPLFSADMFQTQSSNRGVIFQILSLNPRSMWHRLAARPLTRCRTARWRSTSFPSGYRDAASRKSCLVAPKVCQWGYLMVGCMVYNRSLPQHSPSICCFSVAIHAPNTLIPLDSNTCYIVLSYGYLPFALRALLGATNEVFSGRTGRLGESRRQWPQQQWASGRRRRTGEFPVAAG
jgi:hypothetical protein